MHEPLTLRSALAVLARRWPTILLTTLLITGAVVAFAASRPAHYEATAILLTGQDRGIGDVGSILELNQATQSLARLVTERGIVGEAAKSIDVTTPADELATRVSATVPPNTQIIELTVRDTSPRRAARLANAIATRFSRSVEQRSSGASNLTAVVWQRAEIPRSSIERPLPVIGVIALVLALCCGLGLAFLREHLDGSWRSQDDVERAMGVPVLGVVPDLQRRFARRQVYR